MDTYLSVFKWTEQAIKVQLPIIWQKVNTFMAQTQIHMYKNLYKQYLYILKIIHLNKKAFIVL